MFIPIFVFSALVSLMGALAAAFPGMFPVVGLYMQAGAAVATGIYRRTRNLLQVILIYGTAGLVIWFGLIALAIYYSSWTFAVAGFVSTALTTFLLALLVASANNIVTASLAHMNTTAARWSAAIPLRTIPWHAQPRGMKIRSLMLGPVYGLYMLLALPTKGVLEIVQAVAQFGPTLSGWMQLVVEVLASSSVVCWTLATLVMLQLQHNVVIVSLPILGSLIIMIFTLIDLLFLGIQPQIDLKKFIAGIGYANICLNVLFLLGAIMPRMTFTLAHTLAGWHDQFIVNLQSDEFMQMIVGLVVLNVIFRIVVWASSAAIPVTAAWMLICIWGTDISLIQVSAPLTTIRPTVFKQCVGPAGNPNTRPSDCIDFATRTVRPGNVAGMWHESTVPGTWFRPVDEQSPTPVHYNGQQYLAGYPALHNDPGKGFVTNQVWLVPWQDVADKKTQGLNAFSRDWTSYAKKGLAVLGLLVAGFVLVVFRKRPTAPAPAANPAPATPATHGGGHRP